MDKTELKTKAVEAALALAREADWAKISLAEIARQAGIPLSEFYNRLDKDGIVSAIDQHFDLATSAEPISSDETLRERIFDAAMLRFEAMEDHRSAIKSIRKSWKYAPLPRLKAARRRTRTARWLLTCAEADFRGLSARAIILSGILSRAEDAWEKEDSPDFTRTMAQLDRDLRDVEGFAKRMKWPKTKPAPEADPPGMADPEEPSSSPV